MKVRYVAPFLLLAILLRIPSVFEPFWYEDEGVYLTIGEGLRRGLELYKDLYDNKPPGVYIIASIAGGVARFRLILIFWHLVSVVLFFGLASVLFKKLLSSSSKRNAAILISTAAYTSLTSIPFFEGTIANAEIFMIMPILAGVYLLFRKMVSRRNLFFFGILASLAVLFKIPAIFDFIAVLVFWLLLFLKKEVDFSKFRFFLKYALLGFLLLPVSVLGYYWARDNLGYFWQSVIAENIDYLASWQWRSYADLPLTAVRVKGLVLRGILLTGLIGLIFRAFEKVGKVLVFISLWTLFALYSTLLSERPYPHYLLQLMPPISLACGVLILGRPLQRYLAAFLVLISIVAFLHFEFHKFYRYPVISYYQNFLNYAKGEKSIKDYRGFFGENVNQNYNVADFIQSNTSPDQRIFVWGNEPHIYALSKRMPASKYTAAYHVFYHNIYQETLEEIRKEDVPYIVTLEYESLKFPELFSILEEKYTLQKQIGGAYVWEKL